MFKIFVNFCSKHHIFFLFLFFVVFIFLKWPDLYLPLWADEVSYAPTFLWKKDFIDGSFFFPWNYQPVWFMGHPFLHPLILYTVFSVFGPSVFIAKAASLALSLFFLITLYKMTEAVFKDSATAFYSVIFAMFLPVFWVHSSLILADISAMAFGFGSIYALTAGKYKSLLLFSLGMGAIRESSLAFFVPLFLYGAVVPSQRKSLLYLVPGLVLFFLHFFVFFLKTGNWIAHPFVSGILLHNPHAEFFNFSMILNNIRYYFFPLILDIFPLAFFIVAGGSIVGYFALLFLGKKKFSVRKEIFIPLSMCVLWFSFWVIYPDQIERNYFPILFFLIPLGIYPVLKVMPFSRIVCILICGFLFVQTVYIKPYINGSKFTWLKAGYSHTNILNTKAFISYFDKTYGDKIRNSEKEIFSTWSESVFLSSPEYEYVKTPMRVIGSENCQLIRKADIDKYIAAVFREIWPFCIPFYEMIKTSDSFAQIETPFKNYQVFFHRDFL